MTEKVTVLLVVEDDADVRLLVQVTLARDPRIEINGEASSAEEAIRLCHDQTPGLIILDHMLEGKMSGLEAAPRLKAAAPGAKILLFSALELTKEAKAEPAVDAFLLKTHFKDLLRTCQEMVGLEPTE